MVLSVTVAKGVLHRYVDRHRSTFSTQRSEELVAERLPERRDRLFETMHSCVVLANRTGNKSASSCAPIRLR